MPNNVALPVTVVDRKTKKKDRRKTIDMNSNNRLAGYIAEGRRDLAKKPIFKKGGDPAGEIRAARERNRKQFEKGKSDAYHSAVNAGEAMAFGKRRRKKSKNALKPYR